MKRHIYNIITLSLILALYSCGEQSNTSDQIEAESTAAMDNRIQVTQAQLEHSNMILGTLEEKSFPSIVSVNGIIDVPPENRAVVNAFMGGYIKTTSLLVGDVVRKGQVLVTLENPEFIKLQQEYLEVNEQLSYLKSEYNRQVSMKAENITSQKSFLKAESDYKTAVAKHTGLDKQLRMLHISPSIVRSGTISSVVSIYAPISGSITKVNISKGSYLSPATEILEIIDTDHIHLELSVFEKDIMKIKKGQEIDFKIPEASSDRYKAEVHLVGTSIEENRTIKVHGHLENEEKTHFLTGMFINASIITDSAFAKAVPNEAVVEVDGVFYVLVLDQKEGDTYYFNQEEVKVKSSYNGFTVIENKSSFDSETKFLTQGAFNLIGD
ncbi:efflux RND transporter periplasmic adaptor subunit [Nonlabens sp. Ci31]|jgi:cobalt-zinc-cadmium efflux system membrane fusion protein|uniref:efflux RND transporter periplasmic adaptor subunit n=1 Tax=Nonlabens sp. Ci31 TaxID=2608253 RepID=UPI0014638A00|nr:efflux RND transporter periplasmic adaptor subunit [Nonlabens sp. Ci31]QJP34782.1 efflux RND transporter periplasmic adaptor subunit [Nonlabens sp. Ci31]